MGLSQIYEEMQGHQQAIDALKKMSAQERQLFRAAKEQLGQQYKVVAEVFDEISQPPKEPPYDTIRLKKEIGFESARIWEQYAGANAVELQKLLNQYAPSNYKNKIVVLNVIVDEGYKVYYLTVEIKIED